MAGNLKDILSHLSATVEQETLLLYLEGKLSEEQKHELEKKLLDHDFESDALEGLQQVKNKEKISQLVDQLNKDLKKKLEKKKRFRDRLRYKDNPWIYAAVLIILLLLIISYFVIYKMTGS